MTPQEKPEWIEISEGDNSANVRRVSKRLPITALIATLAILGVGAVVAQTQEESPASAIETTTPAPADNLTTSQPEASVPTTPVPAAPSAPAIANPPTKSGDRDDDREEHRPRPHFDDEERGEHEGFGDDD